MQANHEEIPLRFSPYLSMTFTASILTPSLLLTYKLSILRMGSTVQKFLRVTWKINNNRLYKKGIMNIQNLRKVRIILNLMIGTVTRRLIAGLGLRGRKEKGLRKNENK